MAIGGDAVTQTLRWRQDPGTEVVQCHTFKLSNDARIDVRRIQFAFGTGSHHVHVYQSDESEPDGVTDCAGGLAWPRWRLLVGSQIEPLDWTLPDGFTFPVGPRQQLLIQVHWLNLTPAAIDESVQVAFYPARQPGTPVGVMFGVNKQIAILPGQAVTLHQECPLPVGASVVAMMGHFHALGRRFKADVRPLGDAGGQVVYAGTDEATLQFKSFVPLLPIPEGNQITFDCEYFNFRDVAAAWGPDTQRDEHCNLVTYYAPAVEAASFCIQEFPSTSALDSASGVATQSSTEASR